MGIQNRDYYRDEEGSQSVMSDTPSLKRIIILTILIYLAQLIFVEKPDRGQGGGGFGTFSQSVVEIWLNLDTDKVLHGQVWRLVTTALLHDQMGIWHIVINILILFWFGRSLELQLGSREFLFFYIAAALMASFAYVAIQLLTGDRTPAIGASGAVMAVFCLFAMWNPGYTIRVYFLFPIPIIWLLALYVIYDIHPLVLQLRNPQWTTGVAHAAHLGGVAFGFLYYKRCWNLEKLVDRWMPFTISVAGQKTATASNSKSTATSTAKSSRTSAEDEQVDEILAKISRQGESSLNERERELLLEASQRYRQRR